MSPSNYIPIYFDRPLAHTPPPLAIRPHHRARSAFRNIRPDSECSAATIDDAETMRCPRRLLCGLVLLLMPLLLRFGPPPATTFRWPRKPHSRRSLPIARRTRTGTTHPPSPLSRSLQHQSGILARHGAPDSRGLVPSRVSCRCVPVSRSEGRSCYQVRLVEPHTGGTVHEELSSVQQSAGVDLGADFRGLV